MRYITLLEDVVHRESVNDLAVEGASTIWLQCMYPMLELCVGMYVKEEPMQNLADDQCTVVPENTFSLYSTQSQHVCRTRP
jgi:hypothetical protein